MSSEEGHRASKALNGVDKAEQRGFGACKLQWPTDTPSGGTSECPHRTALLNALPLLLGQPRLQCPCNHTATTLPVDSVPLPCPSLPWAVKIPDCPPSSATLRLHLPALRLLPFQHCTLADHAKHDTGTLETVLILLAHSRRVSFFLSFFLSRCSVLFCLGWHQLITRKNNCGCCYCWCKLRPLGPASRVERGMRACVHCFAAPLFDTCLPLPLHYFNLLHHTRTLPNTKATKHQKDPPAPSRPRQRPSWEAQAIIAALDLSSTLSPPILE
jgi:hypothetical protein